MRMMRVLAFSYHLVKYFFKKMRINNKVWRNYLDTQLAKPSQAVPRFEWLGLREMMQVWGDAS